MRRGGGSVLGLMVVTQGGLTKIEVSDGDGFLLYREVAEEAKMMDTAEPLFRFISRISRAIGFLNGHFGYVVHLLNMSDSTSNL